MQFIYFVHKLPQLFMVRVRFLLFLSKAGTKKLAGRGAPNEMLLQKAFPLDIRNLIMPDDIFVKSIQLPDNLLYGKLVIQIPDNKILGRVGILKGILAVCSHITEPVVGPKINVFPHPAGKLRRNRQAAKIRCPFF